MPPTYVSGLLASFLFHDHRNDLFVCESCFHLSVFCLAGLNTNLEEFSERRSVELSGDGTRHDQVLANPCLSGSTVPVSSGYFMYTACQEAQWVPQEDIDSQKSAIRAQIHPRKTAGFSLISPCVFSRTQIRDHP